MTSENDKQTTMAQTQWNKDLPAEAVLKQVLIEKGKLESEVQYLESELAMKNKAIEEFKKWQAKVAERSIYYWLTEGWTFLGYDDFPEETNQNLRDMARELENFCTAIKKMKKKQEAFKNTLQRTKEDKNVQFLFERIVSEESEKEVG